MENARQTDLVVPVVKGFNEPLLAVYNKTVIPYIKECLDEGHRKVVAFYDKVRVRRISEEQLTTADPQLLSFLNINTPRDLDQAHGILAGAPPAPGTARRQIKAPKPQGNQSAQP